MPHVSLPDFLAAVQAGELVSFPTDTVPALATVPTAGDRIYAFKQRSQTKPLILMAASLDHLLPYVQGSEAEVTQWMALTQRHWPGALTLVLPASNRLPAAINPEGTGSLGIRVPDHPLARYLLAHTGPLATTSVNRSGQPPLQTMTEIATQFPELVTLRTTAIAALYPTFTDAPMPPLDQPQGSGQPSTVVAWHNQSWKVLRQGAITLP